MKLNGGIAATTWGSFAVFIVVNTICIVLGIPVLPEDRVGRWRVVLLPRQLLE